MKYGKIAALALSLALLCGCGREWGEDIKAGAPQLSALYAQACELCSYEQLSCHPEDRLWQPVRIVGRAE